VVCSKLTVVTCRNIFVCGLVSLFFRLVPGTQYFYKFGDTYGFSDESTFRAAPVPGPSVTTRVLALGGSYST